MVASASSESIETPVPQTSTSVTPSRSASAARSGRSVTKRSRLVATAALRVAPGPSATTLPWLERPRGQRSRRPPPADGWRTGGAALVPEVPRHPPEALTGLHVHGGGRLVEKHDLGVAGDSDGEADPCAWPPERRSVRRRRSSSDVGALDDLVDAARGRRYSRRTRPRACSTGRRGGGRCRSPTGAWHRPGRRPRAGEGRCENLDADRCGRTRPRRAEMVVDLPAPFGPRSASTSPCGTSRSSLVEGDPGPVAVGDALEGQGDGPMAATGAYGTGSTSYEGRQEVLRRLRPRSRCVDRQLVAVNRPRHSGSKD